MFTCDICDGQNYYEQDGLFYCKECGTQSQEIRVEESQELEADFDFRSIKKLSEKKGRKKKKKEVPGKPWVLSEALQALLKANVERLIEMGFNSKLKDVVGQLWFKYLQQSGVAFCDNEPSVIVMDKRKMTGRHRNTYAMPPSLKKRSNLYKLGSFIDTMDEKYNVDLEDLDHAMSTDENGIDNAVTESKDTNQAEKKRRMRKSQTRNKPKKQQRMDEDFIQRLEKEISKIGIRFSDFGEGGDVSTSSSDETESNEDSDDGGDGVSMGSIRMQHHAKKNSLALKQLHVLCFCFIGLVLVEEPVLVNDLIRWLKEGCLPYHQADDVLPAEMTFSHCDEKVLCVQRYPSLLEIYRHCHALVQHIGVETSYSIEMCQIAAASVIFDLGLPECIFTLVQRLLISVNFSFPLGNNSTSWQCKHRKTTRFDFMRLSIEPTIDAYLAAFIVIAVKLLYYLDGSHEFRDEQRRTVLQLLKVRCVTPTWKQWVSLSSQKRSAKLRNGIPTSGEDLQFIEDLSVYVDYCTQDVFNSFGRRECAAAYRYKNKKEKAVLRDAKETYYNVFSRVAKDSNPDFEEDSVVRVSTSFPCSVSHVGEDLHNLVVGEEAVADQSENIKQDSTICNQQTASNLSSSDSFVCHIKDERQQSEIFTNNCPLESLDNNSDSQSDKNLQSGIDSSILSDSEYVVYSNGTDPKSWHSSYVYLMDVLCERVAEPTDRLQPIVGNLERRLFKQGFNAALGYDLTLQANIRL